MPEAVYWEYSHGVADRADYLDLTVSQAREQFQALLARRPVQSGRQVTFLPVETLLCLAASFVVNRAPGPVPSLGRLFARQVLANCGSRCVFCGLRPGSFGATRMLLAGHIKPWKDSSPAERLDPRNGLAACPAHDVAFDTGMLTVNGGLRIHLARQLADAIQADPLARQYYGQPPLREVILLPEGAQAPARKYLDWHRQKIFHQEAGPVAAG
jgi:hypothetical protein